GRGGFPLRGRRGSQLATRPNEILAKSPPKHVRGVLPGCGSAASLPASVDELDSGDGRPPPGFLTGRPPAVPQGTEIAVQRRAGTFPMLTRDVPAWSGTEQSDEHQSCEIKSTGSDVSLFPVDDGPLTAVVKEVPWARVAMSDDQQRRSWDLR